MRWWCKIILYDDEFMQYWICLFRGSGVHQTLHCPWHQHAGFKHRNPHTDDMIKHKNIEWSASIHPKLKLPTSLIRSSSWAGTVDNFVQWLPIAWPHDEHITSAVIACMGELFLKDLEDCTDRSTTLVSELRSNQIRIYVKWSQGNRRRAEAHHRWHPREHRWIHSRTSSWMSIHTA